MSKEDWAYSGGETMKIENSHKIAIHLDQIKEWEFHWKGKIYHLNVPEVLKLLKLIKQEKA